MITIILCVISFILGGITVCAIALAASDKGRSEEK